MVSKSTISQASGKGLVLANQRCTHMKLALITRIQASAAGSRVRGVRGFASANAATARAPVTYSAATFRRDAFTKVDNKSISVFATDVAPLVGLHPYKPVWEAFEDLWKRNFPNNYAGAKREATATAQRPILSKTEELTEIMATTKNADIIMASAVRAAKAPAMNVSKLRVVHETVTRQVKQLDIPEEVKEKLSTHIIDSSRKEYGTSNEPLAINNLEKLVGSKVSGNNSKFYSKNYGKLGGGKLWRVGGRVDGFVNGELIECKNRVRALPGSIPIYDILQFQAYLAILDLDQGTMVEQLKTDQAAVRRTVIKRNVPLWDQMIIPRLKMVCGELEALESSREKQLSFLLTTSEKRESTFPNLFLPSQQLELLMK